MDMKQDRRNVIREMDIHPSAWQTERDKLWKLASNPFVVVGEAQATKDGIALVSLGDALPEPKLGLAPGKFPRDNRSGAGHDAP